MKILFLTNGYPPRHWAGTETYTAGVAEELCRLGHEVSVICIGDWQSGQAYWNGYCDEQRNGVQIRRLNLNWTKAPDPNRYLYENPVVAEHLMGYLQEQRPDIVHITSCYTLSASVIAVVKSVGLPLVMTLTDFWFLCPRVNLVRGDQTICSGRTTGVECLNCMMHGSKHQNLASATLGRSWRDRLWLWISQQSGLNRLRGFRGKLLHIDQRKTFLLRMLDKADDLIIASAHARTVFEANGITQPIRLLAYGNDLHWLNSYHGKKPHDKLRIGFIGRLSPSKGVHVLIEAFRCAQISDVAELHIYGDLAQNREYVSKLHTLATNSPTAAITFMGTYAHEDSANVFAGIDVLAVPSLWNDYPLVIQEAQATRTPIISSNLGGITDTISHGVNGLLFERGNVRSLANCLKQVVKELGLLAQLAEGTRPVMTVSDHTAILASLYQALVN